MSSASKEQLAKVIHEGMHEEPIGTVFSQARLEEMIKGYPTLDAENPVQIPLQHLVDQKLVQVVKRGSEVMFMAENINEASKRMNMNGDEEMVYSHIQAAGREGIWTKIIKARTNLHQHVVLRSLKSLESQRYIKSVKSVKFPTRKIYMLYHLTPSIEVTGGPWFTDGELDSEFVDSLLTIIWRFVVSKTFPNVFSNSSKLNELALYPATYANHSTVDDILDFIIKSQVTSEELITNDIRSLCQVLVYDDKLEKVGLDQYRATLQSVVDLKEERLDDSFTIFDASSFIATSTVEDENLIYFDEYQL